MTRSEETVWLDDMHEVSLVELMRCSGLPEADVRELALLGALAPLDMAATDWRFSAAHVRIARVAGRLQRDLELDVDALAVALNLLARIDALEDEVARLRALLPRRW